MSLTGPRSARKDIPPVRVLGGGEAWGIAAPQGTDWAINTVSGRQQLEWSGYIDMAGLEVEELTWFTAGAVKQLAGYTNFTYSTAPGSFEAATLDVWTIVSTTPLEDNLIHDGAGDWMVPSFIGSTENPDETIWGQFITWSSVGASSLSGTSNRAICSVAQSSEFGSGTPSASDRLYVDIRIPLPVLGATDSYEISLPPSAVVMVGEVVREDDLAYVERLRRSFALQR